jgi:biopolymer transport protein ExbD
LKEFEKYPSSMGVPMDKMKEFLAAKDAKVRLALETGIPTDSTDNQLAMWILYTRKINQDVQACIKGDSKTSYPIVKKVLGILQDYKVNRFSLITNLEAVKTNVEEIKQ